jgi:hypothetical protein
LAPCADVPDVTATEERLIRALIISVLISFQCFQCGDTPSASP